MAQSNASAGPSSTRALTPSKTMHDADEEEEGDDDRLDLGTLQSFANKIQRQPLDDEGFAVEGSVGRTKIVIPKRGEKDFEPIKETVNLQEMMLQRSREALFGALTGVRGGNSKTMSHALLSASQRYPKVIVARGHLLDSMGIAVRESIGPDGKSQTYTELLPEEALYLLERGSLQIWIGPSAESSDDKINGLGEWSDEEYGIRGAVEMSVIEGFATFIGQDDLSWERYQSYAYLKRLGYTVQRTRRFLPTRFHHKSPTSLRPEDSIKSFPPFRTWWTSIPVWTQGVFGFIWPKLFDIPRILATPLGASQGASLRSANSRGLHWIEWLTYPQTYQSILRSLPHVPSAHNLDTPSQPSKKDLLHNPYLPFWHVWKPATAWSKGTWDRASDRGLVSQRPEYTVAVVNSRDVPLPTLAQLSQVFEELPDEPKGPMRKLGPQYQRNAAPAGEKKRPSQSSFPLFSSWVPGILRQHPVQHSGPNMGALRNGDRALIVAVNDSGNTGWVRFGRTGFADNVIF